MNVNRDTMRLAAGYPSTKGVDARHAGDGPEAVEEKASGDGDRGSRTRGVVTDVYVHWRPIEPCRRDVRRAEIKVAAATKLLAEAVPAAAGGTEEMQAMEACCDNLRPAAATILQFPTSASDWSKQGLWDIMFYL
jgi:hypothetical protein